MTIRLRGCAVSSPPLDTSGVCCNAGRQCHPVAGCASSRGRDTAFHNASRLRELHLGTVGLPRLLLGRSLSTPVGPCDPLYCSSFVFVGYQGGGGGRSPTGWPHSNQASPTAGGPRQSLASEIRLTPLSQEVQQLFITVLSVVQRCCVQASGLHCSGSFAAVSRC